MISIPLPRNVLATAPDRSALLESATAIYLSAFASGVATALANRGMPQRVAEDTGRKAIAPFLTDPFARAELENGLTALLSGMQPGNSHMQVGQL